MYVNEEYVSSVLYSKGISRESIYFRKETAPHPKNPFNEELLNRIRELTGGKNFFTHPKSFEPTALTLKHHLCMCGKDECKQQYLVRYLDENCFIAVGSVCIKKFYKTEILTIEAYERAKEKNGICVNCKTVLQPNNKSKYLPKNCEEGDTRCSKCEYLRVEEFKIMEESIRKEQARIKLEEKEKNFQKEYEQKKANGEIHDLFVRYEELEQFKENTSEFKHAIKYNKNKHQWYYEGKDIPPTILLYIQTPLEIPYNMKDKFKQKYGIKWDPLKGKWIGNKMIKYKIKQELN
jgi:hypothetical protein